MPPGLAEIDAAKADGRWGRAYDSARTSSAPDDLRAALEASPKAKAFFATINASNRYAVLWRVQRGPFVFSVKSDGSGASTGAGPDESTLASACHVLSFCWSPKRPGRAC